MANAQAARLAKQDPRKQYPQPPFPRQPQSVPGEAHKMDPKPDHGEESYRGSGKLEGRKALITGGDSGVGRATAIAYAREGADVAISYLESEQADADEVAKLVRDAGRKVVTLPGDITDEAHCRGMVKEAVEKLGGLDVLVVNAGRQQNRPSIDEVSSEDFDKTMKTNLYAMHWISQAAVPHLSAGASIIFTTSVVAYAAPAVLLDYSTTKAGIVAYAKALSKQMIKKGIRVNAVAPGPFWTALQPSGGQTQEMVTKMGSEDSAYGRPGQPVELAPVYVLLASQEGSYISGEVYGVTGGVGIA